MDFLGIGVPELLVILVLTLIVVGPKRLPETAAQIARAIREFRRYSSGITRELSEAVKDLEREYGDLRGEWKAVSDELRQKAAALGGDLTSIVGEVHEGLQIEAPKPTETPATSLIRRPPGRAKWRLPAERWRRAASRAERPTRVPRSNSPEAGRPLRVTLTPG